MSEAEPPGASHVRYFSLQHLRAIAAIAVLLYHIGIFGTGFAGVDLFFVISGFVMGEIGRRSTPARFAVARLIRIVPLYWAIILVLCALSYVPHLFRNFSFDLVRLSKSLLFIPYFATYNKIWPLFVPGWTLNFEVFFYLLFAIGLIIEIPRVFCIASIMVLVFAGLLAPGHSAAYLTYTSPLLLEFGAGILLSAPFMQRSGKRMVLVLAIGISLALLSSMSGLEDAQSFKRVCLAGIPATVITFSVLALEREGRWPVLIPLRKIGDASYSLYLLHSLVIPLLEKVLPRTGLSKVVIVLACIAIALLSYRFVERPVLRLLAARTRKLGPS